jgi:acetone carboxylase gamma subunit
VAENKWQVDFEMKAKKKRVHDGRRKMIEIRPRRVAESTRGVLRRGICPRCSGLLGIFFSKPGYPTHAN